MSYHLSEYFVGVTGKVVSLFAIQLGVLASTWSGVVLAQAAPQPGVGVVGPESYTTLAVLVSGITAASGGTAAIITFMFKNKNRLDKNDRVTRAMVRHIKALYRSAGHAAPEDMDDL